MFKFTESSEDQLQYSIVHVAVAEPLFLCSWLRDDPGCVQASGAFMCGKNELQRFLRAADAPKLIAMQLLVPSGQHSWNLRTASTVANWLAGGSDHCELVFGDNVELFDSWSKSLPTSGTLIPLWSAPRAQV